MVMIKEVGCEFPGYNNNNHHSLVKNARTAKKTWYSLRTAFQDSGKYRKVSLLFKLMRLELKDCSSVEKYVDKVLRMREA